MPTHQLFSYHNEICHFKALYKMSDECFPFSLRSNVSLSFAIQLHKYYTELYTCNIEYICTKHSYFVYCGLIFLFVLNASMFGVCQRPLCILRWSCLFFFFLIVNVQRLVCEESYHFRFLWELHYPQSLANMTAVWRCTLVMSSSPQFSEWCFPQTVLTDYKD